MGGLRKLLKMYGQINCQDKHGNKTVWIWDDAEGKAKKKSEMTKKEITKSKKAKNN
jgi:hypothetical protein